MINLVVEISGGMCVILCGHLLKDIRPTRSSIRRISPKRRANSPLEVGNVLREKTQQVKTMTTV